MNIQMIGPHSAFETGIWRTMKGELIPLREITDSHLLNLIPYAQRWIKCFCQDECDCEPTPAQENMTKWLHVFQVERMRRGI